jgi:WXG100 family type VII secretion target
MDIKVKHEELNNFQKKIDEGKEDLADLIKQMKEQNQILKTAWEGPDSTAFCDNFDYYLEKMDNLPIVLGNLSKFTKTYNKDIEEKDDSFKRELDKEATKYDDDKENVGRA